MPFTARHRRPAQRGQVDAVQPAGRPAAGAGRRPARGDARPARGRRPARGAALHRRRHRRARGGDRREPARADAGADRAGGRRRRRVPVHDRRAGRGDAGRPDAGGAAAQAGGAGDPRRQQGRGPGGGGGADRGLASSGSASRWRCRPSTASAWTTCCGRSSRWRRAFPDAAEVVEVEVGEEIDDSVDEEGEGAALPAGRPIQIAVVGRPNAGKSTLVNAILGEERLLTGPEAGITRDAIAVQVGLVRHAVPHLRHRRHAQEGEGPGEAREALGLRRPPGGEVRRGGGGAARRADSVRDPGPAASPTSPSARGARWWSRSTSGISRRRSRRS